MSNKQQLQTNNTKYASLIETLRGKAIGGGASGGNEVEYSFNEDAMVMCTLMTYFNDRVQTIGEYAFYSHINLKSVNFPQCRIIGNYAFYRCTSLTSVILGESVTSIGINAFQDCRSLASIIIPNSVTSIDSGAFAGCDSLTSITIPGSVKNISSESFAYCNALTSITIGNGVKNISNRAFNSCNALTSITFEGTVAEWNAISKGTEWHNNCPATSVICSDGDVAL